MGCRQQYHLYINNRIIINAVKYLAVFLYISVIMIKTYIKHQIIDKFINTVFDGFIKMFDTNKPMTFSIGDYYAEIWVYSWVDGYESIIYRDCIIYGISDDSISFYQLWHINACHKVNYDDIENILE